MLVPRVMSMDTPSLVVQSESFSHTATDCRLVCDAGVRTGDCTAGVGYVFVDPRTEQQTAAGLVRLPDTCSVEKAEYAAVLVGLTEAVTQGIQVPIVQTDAKQIVEALRSQQHNTDAVSNRLLSRLTARLAAFDGWAVEHVSRTRTQKADALARRAYEQDGYTHADAELLS